MQYLIIGHPVSWFSHSRTWSDIFWLWVNFLCWLYPSFMTVGSKPILWYIKLNNLSVWVFDKVLFIYALQIPRTAVFSNKFVVVTFFRASHHVQTWIFIMTGWIIVSTASVSTLESNRWILYVSFISVQNFILFIPKDSLSFEGVCPILVRSFQSKFCVYFFATTRWKFIHYSFSKYNFLIIYCIALFVFFHMHGFPNFVFWRPVWYVLGFWTRVTVINYVIEFFLFYVLQIIVLLLVIFRLYICRLNVWLLFGQSLTWFSCNTDVFVLFGYFNLIFFQIANFFLCFNRNSWRFVS